jgi:hypothetical protein
MCLAFGLFYPLDALISRIFVARAAKVHMGMQGLIFVLYIVGLGLGFALSMQFVRSKTISSAHQIIGIIVLVLFLAQAPLGVMLRRAQGPKEPPANQSITPIAYQIKSKMLVKRLLLSHRVLAFVLFALGLTNAGLGFNFALASGYNKLWTPLAIALLVLYFVGAGFRYMYASNKKDAKEEDDHEERMKKAYAEYAARQAAIHGQQSFGHGQPPGYGEAVEMGNLGKTGAQVQVERYEVPVPRPY